MTIENDGCDNGWLYYGYMVSWDDGWDDGWLDISLYGPVTADNTWRFRDEELIRYLYNIALAMIMWRVADQIDMYTTRAIFYSCDFVVCSGL